MKKIKINFQYCYGIKKLEKEFDFSNRNFTIILLPFKEKGKRGRITKGKRRLFYEKEAVEKRRKV